MDLIIGIDVGTSGVKILVIDVEGRVVASAAEEYPLLVPHPGWAEQDPDAWWRATARALRSLWDSGEAAPGQIAAVGFSGQMHGLTALDAAHRPLRPAILWCDQRTTEECDHLSADFGPALLDIACNPPLTGFTLPKILWMKNNEPELYNKIRLCLLPKDYVRLQLTGEPAIDISDAAGTLMLDVARGEWAVPLLESIGVAPGILPRIVNSSDQCGQVTRDAAVATGLREGTPVVAGGADNTCAAVGAGIVHAGRVSSSIGSSGVIFAHTDTLARDPRARVHSFNHSVPGRYYLMGVSLSAGLSFRWFRDTFADAEKRAEAAGGEDAYEALTRLAQQAPPGAEGLLFLPYLTGERTPHKDPHARGVWFGISLRHGRAHVVRSIMEGIVFALKDSLDIITGLGMPVSEIRALGGGGKNEFWRQMQADVFGVPVARLNNDEGPAFGAALLAGVGVGLFDSVPAAADATVRTISQALPRPELTGIYSQAHARFKALYPALKQSFKDNDSA